MCATAQTARLALPQGLTRLLTGRKLKKRLQQQGWKGGRGTRPAGQGQEPGNIWEHLGTRGKMCSSRRSKERAGEAGQDAAHGLGHSCEPLARV